MTLTVQQLKSIAPNGKDSIIQQTVDAFNQYADSCGFNTPLRQAHFIAQIAEESAGFRTTVEYGGKNSRYAPWYGRGLIQTTWEANYQDFYAWCVKNGYNPPEFFNKSGINAVADFPWAFLCAVWYWETRSLNRFADADDIRSITKAINGGYNGLAERIDFLNKAKKVLALKQNPVDVAPGTITTKYKVIDVQKALVSKGFRIPLDGIKGPDTLAAVKMFQKVNGLVPDGVIGPKTSEKLFGV